MMFIKRLYHICRLISYIRKTNIGKKHVIVFENDAYRKHILKKDKLKDLIIRLI